MYSSLRLTVDLMASPSKHKFSVPSLSEMDLMEKNSNTFRPVSHFKPGMVSTKDSETSKKETVGGNRLRDETNSVGQSSNCSADQESTVALKAQETVGKLPPSVKFVDNNKSFTTSLSLVKEGSASEPLSKPKLKASSFAEAFADLQNSKFYEVPVPKTSSEEKTVEVKRAVTGRGNSIIVNPRQRGNPILRHVRNVPWEFGEIIPDYVMGRTACALFLSLRYHQLHPDYIHHRLKELGRQYELRVLLVLIDIKEPHYYTKELAKISMLASCTLILSWSPEEAGRYLETYKAFENKPPDMIMEKTEKTYIAQLTDCLTTVKKVNKTDVRTLLSTFESLEKIVKADKDSLSLCPGLGPQKAKRLVEMFHEPFLKSKKRRTDAS